MKRRALFGRALDPIRNNLRVSFRQHVAHAYDYFFKQFQRRQVLNTEIHGTWLGHSIM